MRIGIVGLGLIGGSLGLALRTLHPPIDVVGLTRSADAAAEALRRGAVEAASTEVAILDGCDVVVVATPIDAIAGVLDLIAPLAVSGTVITDVASVKGGTESWREAGRALTAGETAGEPPRIAESEWTHAGALAYAEAITAEA